MILEERNNLFQKICDRTEELSPTIDRSILLMDLRSADNVFHLKLEELLRANDENFLHDINGITHNIDRSTCPSTNFNYFVPRYASDEYKF